MKLAAIFCVWDDWDLLTHSIENIFQQVDGIIVVYSRKSNYGELSDPPEDLAFPGNCELFEREPINAHALHSETDKRNYGLGIARKQGYTHFITMDADEFYDPDEFNQAKKEFYGNPNLAGLVCPTKVYFGSPTLTIGYDKTLVPFIHKITPHLKHEFNRSYPFAWEGKSIRIDPTRSLNINSGVKMSGATMHHYSWVRKDYAKKIRNSTARANLQKSTIVADLVNAAPGYFCQFYQRPLVRVPNRFGIPEYGENEVRELDDPNL